MNILVVDSDLHSAERISEIISVWGHKTAVASTGDQAVATLEEKDYDAVLVDVSATDHSDLMLVRRLKETKPHVLVVAMNGQDYYNLKFEADLKQSGCYCYTIKPQDEGILLQRVLEHILIRLDIKKMKNRIG